MRSVTKLIRFSKPNSSLLFPKQLCSANSFFPKEPNFSLLGFRKTSSENQFPLAFGSRYFSRKAFIWQREWICPKCQFLNFARNSNCKECETPAPLWEGDKNYRRKPGDWVCSKCEFNNFSHNKKCLRCRETAPEITFQPGEWKCPSCKYVNFRRNKYCPKCNFKKPEEAVSQTQNNNKIPEEAVN